jgi:hypothetical protein
VDGASGVEPKAPTIKQSDLIQHDANLCSSVAIGSARVSFLLLFPKYIS